jgi:hypothetical protein
VNDDKFETYSKTQRASREMVLGRLSLVKLVFLMCMSLALCVIGPFSILAPIPLTMALLLYGYTHALSSVVVIVVIGFLLGSGLFGMKPELSNFFNVTVIVFLFAVAMAFATAETIRKKIAPVKGYLKSGAVLFVATLAVIGIFHITSANGLPGALEEKMTVLINQWKQTPEFVETLNKGGFIANLVEQWDKEPRKVVMDFVFWLPSTLFFVVFMGLWLVHFIVLRNSLVWRQSRHYPFGIRDFISFRTPDFVIYALITGLVLVIVGDMAFGRAGTLIGGNILLALASLYFIQGFGVYLEFLKFTRVAGFMRTMLVAFTVMFAYQFLILIGLLDVWFNFRKFFKNKSENNN